MNDECDCASMKEGAKKYDVFIQEEVGLCKIGGPMRVDGDGDCVVELQVSSIGS